MNTATVNCPHWPTWRNRNNAAQLPWVAGLGRFWPLCLHVTYTHA